jgi:hypothetical protein
MIFFFSATPLYNSAAFYTKKKHENQEPYTTVRICLLISTNMRPCCDSGTATCVAASLRADFATRRIFVTADFLVSDTPILRLVVSWPSDLKLCCAFYPCLYTMLASCASSCALFSVIYLPQFLICMLFTMFIQERAFRNHCIAVGALEPRIAIPMPLKCSCRANGSRCPVDITRSYRHLRAAVSPN